MLNVKCMILVTLPMVAMTVQAAGPTRTRIETRPGISAEVRPTARTQGAERLLEKSSIRDLEVLRTRAALAPHGAIAKSSDALTVDGVNKINGFTQKLLIKVLEKDQDKNVFITGPAMVSAVSMLANGATDRAKEELLSVLGYRESDLEKLNSQASALLTQMNSSSAGVTTSMSNAFFADESLPIQPAYKDVVVSRFKATAQNVQFERNAEAAAKTVNDWASKSTNGMIKNIVTTDSAANLAALLASAVYFKGNWATQFNSQATYEDAFTTADGNRVMVPMMHETMDVEGYMGSASDDYIIARLPYAGKSASMYIILPNSKWGAAPTITPDQALISAMQKNQLSLFKKGDASIHKFEGEDVTLPKFAMKYANGGLKEIFQKLGVNKVFDAGNLTNLSPDQRLKVSYIRMDTALEVDEEGSRAAGVASIGMALESMRQAPFTFNRPFAIVIRDEASGIDLFSGVIRNPVK